MRVFINENKPTETVSTCSWGLADSEGEPILNSVRVWNTEEDCKESIASSIKEWGLEVKGDYK